MRRAALTRLGKVAVKQRLHVQTARTDAHRQYARLLVDHDEPLVLVDDVVVLARLGRCARLARNLDHAVGLHLEVKVRLRAAVDGHTAVAKSSSPNCSRTWNTVDCRSARGTLWLWLRLKTN